ncbi:hypothetical protein FPV67DRAFT_308765 [Lyophyllum atratum]|nr:hypothetical protein FPV67DRAFT_308765 [Lyophyllum atratum]
MSSSTLPFTLAEFGNLVALALNTDHADRFSESFLQFDPELLTPSNTPSGQFSTSKKPPPASDSTSPSSMRTTGTTLSSTWAVSTPSRPRQILDKIKRQASAFVLRTPEGEKSRSQAPFLQTIPTLSPYNGNRHASGSSFFDDEDSDENEPAHFTPYVPLATQYERAAGHSPGSETSNAGLSIFSRPSSDITSPPPSPKSARSISTTSSAAPLTPITPFFAPRPTACSPDAACSARWSLCTDDSSPSSYATSSLSYQKHPFADGHSSTGDDPFAKGSVQVIRHSAHSYDGYGYGSGYQGSSPRRRKHSARRRRTAPAPARPPPSGPLPTPPPSEAARSPRTPPARSEKETADGSTEWTLKLAPRVVAANPTASLSPAPNLTTQRNAKPKGSKRILRIRVSPSTAFSETSASKVQDWTLSLPLDVAVARSPSPSPLPSPTASLHVPSESRPQPRSRTHSYPFLSYSSSSSSDLHSHCPSSWHPTPPPSAPLPPPPSKASQRSTSRSSSGSSARASKLPHPPRTADSTTSTASTDTNASSASTESTATIVPNSAQRQWQRERERTLATLIGPAPLNINLGRSREAHRERETSDTDSVSSGNTGTYYSARSSFTSQYSMGFGSAYGCQVRVRVNSADRR